MSQQREAEAWGGEPAPSDGPGGAGGSSGAAAVDPGSHGGLAGQVDAAVALVRRRLTLRAALAGAGPAGWSGGGIALAAGLAWSLRLWDGPTEWLLALPVLGAGVGAALAARRFDADDAELALAVDRMLGTHEVAVTALEVERGAQGGGFAELVRGDARQALESRDAELRDGLPLKPPRSLLALPLLAVLLLLPMAPRASAPPKLAGPAGSLSAEAERLAERRDELKRDLAVELPEEIDREFDELVQAMKSGQVSKGQASERAEALRKKLEEHVQRGGLARQVEEASELLQAVDPQAAQDLKDALADADLDEAKQAIDRMRQRMDKKSSAEREQAARQLEKAAQEAAKMGMPGLGGALKQEADRARQGNGQRGGEGRSQAGQGQGQQGGQQGLGQQGQGQQAANGQQGQGGQQGQQTQGGQGQGGQQANAQGQQGQQGQQGRSGSQGQQGGSSGQQGLGGQESQGQGGQQASNGQSQSGQGGGQGQGGQGGLGEFLDQLDQQGMGGGGLQQEMAQREAAQQLDQALGGAQGRVSGNGKPGQGGRGRGGQGQASWGAGSDHTNADQGQGQQKAGFQDMDRQVDGRTSKWVMEHDQPHGEQRLDGVKALAASVNGHLNDGPIDVEHMRLSGSGERSGGALLQAPPGYKQAAEEAIEGESVPRSYRDQVKAYFDAIE